MQNHNSSSSLSLLVSSEEYFTEMVSLALVERKVEAPAPVKNYLVNLLQFYLDTKNLFDEESIDETGKKKPQTLAELFLVAHQSEYSLKVELLKKLADRALYISGFFSDSLQRKIVDVDYYVDMGGSAYASLAHCTKEDSRAHIYHIFSKRFSDFVDVLSVLSQKSQLQSNQNILRLYDRYHKTGSELDREKLIEMGLLTQEPTSKRKITMT